VDSGVKDIAVDEILKRFFFKKNKKIIDINSQIVRNNSIRSVK